jgi:hypothetical protein
MRLPIDTTGVSFLCAGDAEPVLDYDSGRPKLDRSGQPLYSVSLVGMADGLAEVIAVKIPGEPKAISRGAAVRPVGLSANPWTICDRSGIAYRAERIEVAKAAGVESRSGA